MTTPCNRRIRQRSEESRCRRHTLHWIQLVVGLWLVTAPSFTSASGLRGPAATRHLPEIQPRIVGGSAVDLEDHPYFVYWDGVSCGGAVIHDDIVISAAHCFDPDNPPASRWIYMNSTIRKSGFRVRYIHEEVHPKYNTTNHEYDFVLLKTAGSMLARANGAATGVETIAINRDPTIPEDDEPVLAVGYGQLSETSLALSSSLRDVLLYYVPNDVCANQYHEEGRFNPETMFCTGVPGGGKDTCKVRSLRFVRCRSSSILH